MSVGYVGYLLPFPVLIVDCDGWVKEGVCLYVSIVTVGTRFAGLIKVLGD